MEKKVFAPNEKVYEKPTVSLNDPLTQITLASGGPTTGTPTTGGPTTGTTIPGTGGSPGTVL